MTHMFTVGEYTTRGGFNAVVLEEGPDETLFGREQRNAGGYWYSKRWTLNGKNKVYQKYGESDLVPPTRKIWTAIWRDNEGVIHTGWSYHESDSLWWCSRPGCTEIARTGPHEVPA